jgi:NTE family protein
MSKGKSVNLVLSGGGMRGLAHIGVLKELEKNNIRVRMIAGSSSGAIIGALYASCLDAKNVEDFIKALSFYKLPDFSWSSQGLMKGSNIRKYMQEFMGVETFADLKIPLVVNATDLVSGKQVVFKKGNVLDAVRASIGYPGLLTPVSIGDRLLVDGGIVNPVPVDLISKSGVTVVSDVTVNLSKSLSKSPHMVDVLSRSVSLLQRELIATKLSSSGRSVVYVQPDTHEWDLFMIRNDPRIVHRGELAMQKSMKKLLRLL